MDFQDKISLIPFLLHKQIPDEMNGGQHEQPLPHNDKSTSQWHWRRNLYFAFIGFPSDIWVGHLHLIF